MLNTVKDFMATDTYAVERGYIIHISRSPEFATQAVIENQDGEMELVDVSEVSFDDFEEFLDAIVEKYETGLS